MAQSSIPSTLDITDWLCRKASATGRHLSEPQIQHLLFLAQLSYAQTYQKALMPTLFICDIKGFYDSTIRHLMQFGLPLMPKPQLSSNIEQFLEQFWSQYGKYDTSNLERIVMSLECWKQSCLPHSETIVNPLTFIDSSSPRSAAASCVVAPKIMLSQNGPVKVSAWHPRRLQNSPNKGVKK